VTLLLSRCFARCSFSLFTCAFNMLYSCEFVCLCVRLFVRCIFPPSHTARFLQRKIVRGARGGENFFPSPAFLRSCQEKKHHQHLSQGGRDFRLLTKNQKYTNHDEMPYEPKNILITGGAGFIASHVAILFAKKYPQCKVR